MKLVSRFAWLFLGALAVGCSNEVSQEPTGGLDTKMGDKAGATMGGGSSGGGSAATDACTNAANYQARGFAFDTSDTPREFADAVNALVHAQTSPPLSVSNYMAPHCVWMVAFSAPDETTGRTAHAATYTEMSRHPAGMWTAAPQTTGWIRVVDAAKRTVWIPIESVTGSANYGATDCSTLSTAQGSAVIPRSAGALPITTSGGATTLGDLLGKKTAKDGWQVRFTFAGEIAR